VRQFDSTTTEAIPTDGPFFPQVNYFPIARDTSAVGNGKQRKSSSAEAVEAIVLRKNSIWLPSDRDVGTCFFGFSSLENLRS
jgi:hypothetical protein